MPHTVVFIALCEYTSYMWISYLSNFI